jgi:FtsH-binding integral membrane protein
MKTGHTIYEVSGRHLAGLMAGMAIGSVGAWEFGSRIALDVFDVGAWLGAVAVAVGFSVCLIFAYKIEKASRNKVLNGNKTEV